MNLYTDPKYVVNLFPAIENILLLGSSHILLLLQQLQKVIQTRREKVFVGHIRGHSNLPGPLFFGNTVADMLTKEIIGTALEQVQESHQHHHQNALALKRNVSNNQRTSKANSKKL